MPPTFLRKQRDYKAAVGGHWEDVGRLQFDFLVNKGLTPQDRLLDVACGSFRAGRFLINYLEPGKYLGVEADGDLMGIAKRKVLGRRTLREKRPQLAVCRMPAPLPEADIGWIHALFDHIPPADVSATIRHAGRATPRFFATFFITDTPDKPRRWLRNGAEEGAVVTQVDSEYWHHSPDFVKDAALNGDVEIAAWHGDYGHPLGLTVVEFARASRR